jgi:hypothetical protein
MARSKPMTAGEFARSLAADPQHQARMAAQAAATAALGGVCAADEASLLRELHEIGAPASSVYNFVNAGGAPVAALPVLVRHLHQQHHPRIWEGIVRALSIRHAHDLALPALMERYAVEQASDRRWLLANAIGSMAKFAEVAHLDGIAEYRPLFRQTRKQSSRPSA